MIIEDDADCAGLIAEMLMRGKPCPRSAGFFAVHAGNLSGGLSRLAKDDIDAVLLDLRLPESQGLETLDRTLSLAPDTPVIVLTGSSDETLTLEAMQRGAQDYLVKGDFDCNLLTLSVCHAVERKKAEMALRRSEVMFREFVENAGDLICQVDTNGAYVYVSPNAESILGYAPQELIGKSFFDLMPPEDARRVAGVLGEAVQSGRAFSLLEHVVMRKDGRLRTLECGGRPVFDEKGALTGFRGISRDITERRRMEQQLRASEERFRHLVEHAADALFLCDRDKKFMDVNRAACVSLGYSRRELLGMSVADVEIGVPADTVSRLGQELRIGDTRTVEGVHRRKDGTVFPVEVRLGMFESKEGPLVLAMARDITERKQAERALKESEERLRQSQKLETVGRLAGGIAHDFNNLLTAIDAYCEFLLAEFAPGDKRHGDVEGIRQAGERAASLTRQLLAFSRRQVLNPEVLSLNSVVEGVEKMLRRTIGENINLVTALRPDLRPVRVDPGQMEQIILNLAVNARDAMPHGGKLILETANVEFEEAQDYGQFTVPRGLYVMLAVSDTGAGMDKDALSHLFEPFFTTKEQGKGTGLGLSTVYGIVKQSQGYILVYSEPGQGSTFKIYLPCVARPVLGEAAGASPPAVQVPGAPRPAGASPLAVQAPLPGGQGPSKPPRGEGPGALRPAEANIQDLLGRGSETILLVEDDPVVFRPTLRSLRQSGYKVLGSCNGEEAVEICRRYAEKIDLVITDMVMPRLSGRELVGRLTALRPEMKVLYISGYTDETVFRNGILEPGMQFLQKPFTPAALARKVREVLGA